MEIPELQQELENHKKKMGEILTRQFRIKQIIKPHQAELDVLDAEVNYEAGVIDMLDGIIRKYNQTQNNQ